MTRSGPQGNTASAGIRDFLAVLFKHKKKVLTVFLGIFLSVMIVSLLLPSQYKAESTLLVKFGREYINRPEVGETPPLLTMSQQEILNSEVEIMSNPDLARSVISAMGVGKFHPDFLLLGIPFELPFSKTDPLDQAVAGFEKRLSVEAVRKSNVIKVSYVHKDPRVAADAVNLLVEKYKERHLQVFSDPKSSFLEQQLAGYRQKLEDAEKRMESFRQENRVYSIDEQRTLLLRRHSDLDASLKTALLQAEELGKRLATIVRQQKVSSGRGGMYTNSERERIIVEARAKLLALQLQEQEQLKLYNEDDRLVRNTRTEIRLVRDFLAEQEKEIAGKVKTGNAVYQEMEKDRNRTEAELSAQTAKAGAIRAQLAALDRQIAAFDLLDKRHEELNREQSEYEKLYKDYLTRVEEARVSLDMNRQKMSNIGIIREATPPNKPARPRRMVNIVLGFILGAISAVGAACLCETAAQRFSTPESVERYLGVPVLASISLKEPAGHEVFLPLPSEERTDD